MWTELTAWRLFRCVRIALGLAAILFAGVQWAWFQRLPQSAFARRCGNCLLAAVGVPIEMGLVGLVVVAAALSGVRWGWRCRPLDGWVSVTLGTLLTPYVLGLPLFAFGLLVLTGEMLRQLRERRLLPGAGPADATAAPSSPAAPARSPGA